MLSKQIHQTSVVNFKFPIQVITIVYARTLEKTQSTQEVPPHLPANRALEKNVYHCITVIPAQRAYRGVKNQIEPAKIVRGDFTRLIYGTKLRSLSMYRTDSLPGGRIRKLRQILSHFIQWYFFFTSDEPQKKEDILQLTPKYLIGRDAFFMPSRFMILECLADPALPHIKEHFSKLIICPEAS
ncbi:unnamed protein product [Cuscuta epithymum]|uniref:Uncharacterized protein n=1 Tax=Cuscuta epithymum TaxID=186058 RepID=A0AAV0FGW0_9ASTE|nr:unnamed protein product [Cuscuta epithymum]